MDSQQQAHFDTLYQTHLDNLTLQGLRPATVEAYARAIRRISAHFDCPPDNLSLAQLKAYFVALIRTHSWSTVKLDRNGLQFFYRHTLNKQWQWLNIVKPPQVKRVPDPLSVAELSVLLSLTHQRRYQCLFFTLYSLGLRLGEGLSLTVADIDSAQQQVHIRNAKGGKDRLLPLPQRTLKVLRHYWRLHRNPRLLFPGLWQHRDLPMNRGGVQKAFRRGCQDAGIAKRVSPHSLRHSFATHLLQQGVDFRSLQRLLGHGSLNTTARYAQLTQVKMADTHQALNRLADTVVIDWKPA